MNPNNNIKNILLNIFLLSYIYGAIGINLFDNGDNSYTVKYNNPLYSISSFQFDIVGATIDTVYGGVINDDYSFSITINPESQTILIQNSGELITQGTSGSLVEILLNDTPSGLNNIIILDESNSPVSVEYNYYGCGNENACNYNSYITVNSGSYEQEFCRFPCSLEGGCLIDNEEYTTNYEYFDCSGDCAHIDSCTGCMDDGYQQLSPHFGSPACNYNPSAIIESECLYNDCRGECGGSAVIDECGICEGNNLTCLDCSGIANGSAYINHFCTEFNSGGCVGGDTGYEDCIHFLLPDTLIYYSKDIISLPVYVYNLDTLKSLEVEIHYENILEISGFNLYNTNLNTTNYSLNHSSVSLDNDSTKTTLSIFYEPSESSSEMYFSQDISNIINIELSTINIENDNMTQLNINKMAINEHHMNSMNWSNGIITIEVPKGCIDDGYQQWSPTIGTPACNYDSEAIENDGSCWYPNAGCSCSDDQGAVVDICGVCDGGIENEEDCTCTNPDCFGDCPPLDGCMDGSLFEKGCAFIDECSICVGGLTEIEPCIEDCAGVLGGLAYEDACENCINSEDIDCLNANFKIYDYNGIDITNTAISVSDTVIAAVYFENIPNIIEGIDLNINFDPELLSIIDWNLHSSNINDSLNISSVLDSYYDCNACDLINDSTFSGSIYYTNPLNNSSLPEIVENGNIIFFTISPLGAPDNIKTYFRYKYIIINENEMKEENYFSEELLLSFNGNKYTLPKNYILKQNYPNPFNPITTIEYFVSNYDYIDINIFNINGQIVNHLVANFHNPGTYFITWNGTDNNGFQLSSGIYYYKMVASDFISTKKLIILK